MKKYDKSPARLKNDIILILALLLLSAVILIVRNLTHHIGSSVEVTVNGTMYAVYSLAEDTEINIEGIGGHNLLVIKDGKASVRDSDCPDRICARHRSISQEGETIVCLPHRVVVTVVDRQSEVGDE